MAYLVFDNHSDNAIYCPWCGYQHSDPQDFFSSRYGDETEIDCYGCEKRFIAARYISITYSTSKPK